MASGRFQVRTISNNYPLQYAGCCVVVSFLLLWIKYERTQLIHQRAYLGVFRVAVNHQLASPEAICGICILNTKQSVPAAHMLGSTRWCQCSHCQPAGSYGVRSWNWTLVSLMTHQEAFFHVLPCHLYVYIEPSVKVFGSVFKIGLFGFSC